MLTELSFLNNKYHFAFQSLSASELQKLTEEEHQNGFDYWKKQIENGGQLMFQRPGKIEFESDDDDICMNNQRSCQRSRSRQTNNSAACSRSRSRNRNLSEISNCPSSFVSNDTRNHSPCEFSDPNLSFISNQCASDRLSREQYRRREKSCYDFDNYSYPEDSLDQSEFDSVQQSINHRGFSVDGIFTNRVGNQFGNQNLSPIDNQNMRYQYKNTNQFPNNNQILNYSQPLNNNQYPNSNIYSNSYQYPNHNSYPSTNEFSKRKPETTENEIDNGAKSASSPPSLVCSYLKRCRNTSSRTRKKTPTRKSDKFVCNYPDKVVCNYPDKEEFVCNYPVKEEFVCNYPKKGKTSENDLESSESLSSHSRDKHSVVIVAGANTKKQIIPVTFNPNMEQEQVRPDGIESPHPNIVPEHLATTPRRRPTRASILRSKSRSRSSRDSSRGCSVDTVYESGVDDELKIDSRCRKSVTFNEYPDFEGHLTLSKRLKRCFGITNVAGANKLYWCILLGILIIIVWIRVLLRYSQTPGGATVIPAAVYYLYYLNVTTILLNLYEKIMIMIDCECKKFPHWLFYLLTLIGATPGNAISISLFHAKDRSISYQNKLIFVSFLHLLLLWFGYRRVLKL